MILKNILKNTLWIDMCFFFPGGHLILTCIYFILFGHLHPSIQLPIQQLPSGPILGHGVFPALKSVFQAVEVIQTIGTCGTKPPGTQSRPCSAPAFLKEKTAFLGANPR